MIEKFININALIIDMDGVLWHGDKPLKGLHDFFNTLRKKQLNFILATNNSTLTPSEYIRKLAKMGITVAEEEILTSSMVTAAYLVAHYPPEKNKIFMIGENGLKEALLAQGFVLKAVDDAPDANLVVCGLDRKLQWNQLATATLTLRAGAQFIATNGDTTLPTELGLVPGNGSTLAALETASGGIKPLCLGKPEPLMYQHALKLLNKEASETITVGDRLDTDILGSVRANIRSVMVLTGISSTEDLKTVDYRPTWVMDDLSTLIQAIKDLKT